MLIAAIFFIIIYYLLSESIVEEQEDAQDAEADAIGDAVAEHHRNTNQGRDDECLILHISEYLERLILQSILFLTIMLGLSGFSL